MPSNPTSNRRCPRHRQIYICMGGVFIPVQGINTYHHLCLGGGGGGGHVHYVLLFLVVVL